MAKYDITDLPEELEDEEVEDSAVAGISASAGTHRKTAEQLDEADLLMRQLAALTVRRQCNQHGCTLPATGACGHAEHRRDVDYLAHCLEVLDLPRELPQITDEDRKAFLKGTVKRGR